MDSLQKEIELKINELTRKNVAVLTEKWREMYDHELVVRNLHTLVEHVDTFYEEILIETTERREKIVKTIERLQTEQNNLKRVLNADVQIDIPDDIPLYSYQEHLDISLESLRDQLQSKREEINRLIRIECELCDELSEPKRDLPCDDLLPNAEAVNEFVDYLNSLKMLKKNRQNSIAMLKKNITALYAELEIQKSESMMSLLESSSLKIHIVKNLELEHKSLTGKRTYIKETIDCIKNKLEKLWECLEIDSAIRTKILNHTTCTEATLSIWQSELSRCELLKRQNIQKFVERVREEIIIYWDKTMKSDQERARFVYFTSDLYNEDLLSLHELELNDLKHFYEENLMIFEKYNEHKTLWDRLMALDEKENEPGRLNNRGGQLLKEEKERRMINVKLPKLRAEIRALAEEYEAKCMRKFMIWGMYIEDVIEADYKNRQIIKEQQQSARKAGKDLQVTTTVGQSTFRTPMSATKIGSVSSIKRVASTTSLYGSSTKKSKMLTDSTTTDVKAKRNLLGTYSNKKLPRKSPLKRVISTLTVPRRRSSRRSGGGKKNGKSSKKSATHSIIIKENDVTISYDEFEEHIASRTPCRSSEIRMMNTHAVTGPKHSQMSVPRAQTPARLPSSRVRGQINAIRTPQSSTLIATASSSIARSPTNISITPAKRQLTTKNVPINF